VYIYDTGPTNPPILGEEYIVANDFGWSPATGPGHLITDAEAKFLSGVIATGATGYPLNVTNNITVDATELADIHIAIGANDVGSKWPLTFTTDGSTGPASSVTINVTLYDNGPPNPPVPGSEFIVANDFSWFISLGNLTDLPALTQSKTIATDANGKRMDLSSNVIVDATELLLITDAIVARQSGTTWPLTFTTDGSTGPSSSVTVIVTLTTRTGGSGTGNATVIPNNTNNTTPSQPQDPQQPTPERPAGPTEREPEVAGKGTWSLLSILLLIMSVLLALAKLPRIYKTRQLRKGNKITAEIEKPILIFQGLVIVASIVLIIAFFLLYSFKGAMAIFLAYDLILLIIFVIEAIFFWQAYNKLKKAIS
jgi:hypothetical protein